MRTIFSVQKPSALITIFASDSSKRSAGDSPRGLGGHVGWSTVWPASCVARFSPRTSLPRVGRSTRGFLSVLLSLLLCSLRPPCACCSIFGVPFDSNRCACFVLLVYFICIQVTRMVAHRVGFHFLMITGREELFKAEG